MYTKLIVALAVIVALLAYGARAYPPHRGDMGRGSNPPPPAGSLTGVLLSNNTFISPAPDGTVVGAITVQGTGNIAATTLSITGDGGLCPGSSCPFRLSNTTVPSNLLVNGTQNTGTYAINLVATLPGAAGSPFTQPETVIGAALTITSVSISCGGSCAFTPGQAGNIGTASVTVSSGSPTGTWSLKTSGTDHTGATCGPATNLSFTSGGVLSNNSSAIAGTYPVCLQYTQASAGNSPYAQVVTVTGTSLPPGLFVATNGTNNGTCSISQPCTFAAAQTAMQNSSTKRTYVRASNYTFGSGVSNCDGSNPCAVHLGSNDTGETWQYYPPDGVNTATLDGQSTASGNGIKDIFKIDAGSNITIDGLKMTRFEYAGVLANGGSGITVRNNDVSGGTNNQVGVGNPSAILMAGSSNVKVNNNFVHDMLAAGGCISLLPPYSGSVDHNFTDNCPGGGNGDSGPIYSWDGPGTASSGASQTIEYNYSRNFFAGSANGGVCLYMDQGSSNATSRYNVCEATGQRNNNSQYMIFTNASQNNTYPSNIFDLPTQSYIWGDSVRGGTGLSFQGSIIISPGGGGGWTNNANGFTISNNLYFNYGGLGINTAGDTAPVTGQNPAFLTCPGGGVDSWSYKLSPTSPAHNFPVSFPAQPSNWGTPGFWGPPGFTIPHTGTPPSYGPTC